MTRFKKLIIHHTFHIPSDTHQNTFPWKSGFGQWRADWSLCFVFRAIEIDLNFISGDYFVQKVLFLEFWEKKSTLFRRCPILISINLCGTHFPTFWIFPSAFKRLETVDLSTPSCSASCDVLCAGFSSSNSTNSSVWSSSGLPDLSSSFKS